MGTFSKLNRFREAGQEANVVNTEKFGQPKKSLFTTSKLISLKRHIDVTDNLENVVYQANTKVFTLLDKTDITDAAGKQVAHIEKKFLSFHERHYVTMADGTKFELSNEFFRIIKDITNIEGLGWQLRGNILGLNFELYDATDNIIAVISQKLISLHDKYCMDIYQLDKEQIVVAILITLQHMIKDRENNQAAYSGSN
ncbi:MAG: LURP-one-related family protein [Lachnospiraceae bacterium]|nr:LURP-one-related family protein [Lachnospiraceae bacterium]